MEFEAERLLGNEKHHGDAEILYRRPARGGRVKALVVNALVGLIAFAIGSALTARGSVHLRTNDKSTKHLYSPLSEAIEYTIDKPPADLWANPLYTGPPSDESERAWNKMLHPHGFQVFPEEAQHFDELNTVQLKDGNHVFITGLFHNLHCIRRFRQLLWEEHYYPNMTAETRKHEREHSGHCLEAIRTSMLCNPDLTLNRYEWTGKHWAWGGYTDLSVIPDVKRECVNWNKLEAAMKSRRYDPMDTIHDGVTQGEYKGSD